MFDVWMELGKDVEKLEKVYINRKVTKSTEQHMGWSYEKFRDVRDKKYGGDVEKTKKALEGVTSIADDLLPDDQDERLYLVKMKQEINKHNGVSDEFGMKCEMAADEPMLNDIMGEHGLLSGSEAVKITGMSDQDQCKFWAQVHKAEGAKVKKITQPKDLPDPNDQGNVETVVDRVKALMPKMLKESAEARTFSVSLTGTGMSDQMVQFMSSHSVWLEKAYGVFNSLIKLGVNEDSNYDLLIANAENRMNDYKQYKSIAQTMKKKC